MKRLLRGGTVVSGKEIEKKDILINEAGKIGMVADNIDCDDAEIIDVSGRLIFPGFIDAHTHFELHVAGTVTADDFESGTKAAIAGGTTTIVDYATQYKGESLTQAIDNWHKRADGKCFCDYGFHLAISDWNKDVYSELEQIITQGVSSFKLYMTYDDMIVDDRDMYQILKRLHELGGIAGIHCENSGIIKARVEEEKSCGHMGTDAHPRTRPAEAEAEAVSRLLKIADLVGTPVIIVHLSSKAGYREVCYARERGQKVYLETCPQYLLLDESRYNMPDFDGSRYVCAPPLRDFESRKTLWKAIADDRIQTISTDHCSFTLKQKMAGIDDFTKIPNGMPGVESRPVLIYTYGVKNNKMSLKQMCRMLCENPAKLYGMYPQKGVIAPGSDADIVVWDADASWTITDDNGISRAEYNPFAGTEVTGKPERVFLRGKEVVNNGKITDEHNGLYVKRKLMEEPYGA